MRWFTGFAVAMAALGLVAAVVWWLGSRLPEAHLARASAVIDAPQARVWHLMTDIASQPAWRKGLKQVHLEDPVNGLPCWTEDQGGMKMRLCAVEEQPMAGRVVRIADPTLPFGGDWTYDLAAAGDRTTVTITEHGTVGPPFWRFISHYVMKEDTQIKQYLKDLQAEAARQR